jgi:hypothetical protein
MYFCTLPSLDQKTSAFMQHLKKMPPKYSDPWLLNNIDGIRTEENGLYANHQSNSTTAKNFSTFAMWVYSCLFEEAAHT